MSWPFAAFIFCLVCLSFCLYFFLVCLPCPFTVCLVSLSVRLSVFIFVFLLTLFFYCVSSCLVSLSACIVVFFMSVCLLAWLSFYCLKHFFTELTVFRMYLNIKVKESLTHFTNRPQNLKTTKNCWILLLWICLLLAIEKSGLLALLLLKYYAFLELK